MGRATPCCGKLELRRGAWTPEEDLCLTNYVNSHGEGRWRSLSKKAGLLRSGKSCRMRWLNYLQPNVKGGHILPDEEDLILRLHRLLGNRWSLIAGRIPGRTDNDIKNYWNSHLSKKLISQGIDPRTHKPFSESEDIWWIPQDCNLAQKVHANPGTHDHKDSDFVMAGDKEEQIISSVATSEIVGYGEVSNSQCCENPKQGTFCSRFPYSLSPTPPAAAAHGNIPSFLNEEFEPAVGYNFVLRSELVGPRSDL